MPTNEFDTGSILGNLFNDIKHIPERRIQDSRAIRADLRSRAIDDQRRREADLNDKLGSVGLKRDDYHSYEDALAAYLPAYANQTRIEKIKDRVAEYAQGLKEKAGALGIPVGSTKVMPGVDLEVLPTGQSNIAKPAPSAETLAQTVNARERDQRLEDYGIQRDLATSAAEAAARAKRRQDEFSAFRTQTGRDPSDVDMTPDGNLTASALHQTVEAKAAGQLTAAQRNARAAVDSGIKAGYIKPEDSDAAFAAYEQWGGRAQPFPESERHDIGFNQMSQMGLQALREKANAAGAGAFGPIANRYQEAVGSVFGGFQPTRAADQAYNEVKGGRAFAQGGKTLTPTELGAIVSQIGSPTDSDFLSRLNSYGERQQRDIRNQIDRLQASPHRFTPEGSAAIRTLQSLIEAQPTATTDTGAGGAGFGPEKLKRLNELRARAGKP